MPKHPGLKPPKPTLLLRLCQGQGSSCGKVSMINVSKQKMKSFYFEFCRTGKLQKYGCPPKSKDIFREASEKPRSCEKVFSPLPISYSRQKITLKVQEVTKDSTTTSKELQATQFVSLFDTDGTKSTKKRMP